jgi:hypothetical protein
MLRVDERLRISLLQGECVCDIADRRLKVNQVVKHFKAGLASEFGAVYSWVCLLASPYLLSP